MGDNRSNWLAASDEQGRPADSPVPTIGWCGLAGGLLIMAYTWGNLLPTLAQHPSLAAALRRWDTLQVNPAAVYYTELESLQPIVHQIDRGETLWSLWQQRATNATR
ncbi:MAG: hypothetical protein KatS3mg114_1412 [Planctomycetaceae bacterium]|nr:MAG: hypothetical protein KatS3mg114_1412 [Planctomycetaceae bacterium]